jgi:hypothetical protein
MSLKPAPTNAASVGPPSNSGSNAGAGVNQADVPFLVTHWLANYEGQNKEEKEDLQRKEAMERIRKATSEIASAFASLGVYGTTFRVSNEESS